MVKMDSTELESLKKQFVESYAESNSTSALKYWEEFIVKKNGKVITKLDVDQLKYSIWYKYSLSPINGFY